VNEEVLICGKSRRRLSLRRLCRGFRVLRRHSCILRRHGNRVKIQRSREIKTVLVTEELDFSVFLDSLSRRWALICGKNRFTASSY